MDTFVKDLRFAVRTMAKAPVFTAVAVASLALGIGANATIFTVVNAIFLSALPVQRANELVAVYTEDANAQGGFGGLLQVSYPNYEDIRDRNEVFSSVAAYTFPVGVSAITDGDPAPATIEIVTGNYFETLGLAAARGRALAASDDITPGGHPVVVVSHGFWQRRLGGTPDAVNREIKLNGVPFTVVGVAREGFKGVNALFSPDAWVPYAMREQTVPSQFREFLEDRRALGMSIAGRLRPGISAEQATAYLATLGSALEQEHPVPNKGRSFTVRPLTEATIFPQVRGAFVTGSGVLMVIVGLVLLIACSNVANLLMARATARQQEMAVRTALGAGRGRLVRQLLTENLLLALGAGVVGLGLATLARDSIWSLRPAFIGNNFVELTIDGSVLAFTLGLSILTSVVFGLAPAWQASRTDVVQALKEEARSAGASPRRRIVSNALVVGQVALSAVALVAAGLFLRSLAAGNRIDPGFRADGLAAVAVNPGQGGYDQARGELFYREVKERVAALPGVQSVAWANAAPLTGSVSRTVTPADRETDDARSFAATVQVGPGYFSTLGVRLLQGRDFTDADGMNAPRVAIVNDTFAERLWPGQNAVGKRFRFFDPGSYHEVVGVVSTAKFNFIGEDPQLGVYIPAAQNYSDFQVLFVRSQGDPAAALGMAQQAIRAIDRQVPVVQPGTMAEVVAQSLWAARMAAILLGTLGLVALVLASIGLYGLMAYSVSQRRKEIGLRMALGADRPAVMRQVLGQGLALVAGGLVLGILAAVPVGKAAGGLLFGVSATDPITFGAVAVILGGVALGASLLPALRASRVDPIVALR